MKNKLRSLHKERMKLLCEAHKNVVRLEANINYTTFTLQTGKTQTMSYNLALYGTINSSTSIYSSKSVVHY